MIAQRTVWLLASGMLALAACRTSPSEPDAAVAAQVGDAVLTEAEVAEALASVPPGIDSAEARRQIIEPWVRRELLVQQARTDGLADRPDIRRRLDEAERSALEAAALDEWLDEEPSDEQIETYYTAHPDQFTLDASAVRIRHLRVRGAARAQAAVQALGRVAASRRPDSTFALAARELSDDPAGSVALAGQYVSEAELAETDPILARDVAGLQPGGPAVAFTTGQTVHVVQLVDRQPAGAVLPLAAVRDAIAERLAVDLRKDSEARLVESLRADAEARRTLRVR